MFGFLLGFCVGTSLALAGALWFTRKALKFIPTEQQCLKAWKQVNGSMPTEVLRASSIEKARSWLRAWRNIDLLDEGE
jgi:3-keto-L-gulonate-6-phosphate decarboxylase